MLSYSKFCRIFEEHAEPILKQSEEWKNKTTEEKEQEMKKMYDVIENTFYGEIDD